MRKNLLAAVLISMAAIPSVSFSQDVIINEWTQGNGGNKEWVELLVTNGPVDMRGWTLGDSSPGDLTFSSDAFWSAVPTGAIVVIYNGADRDTVLPADDTDLADFSAIVASNNATYFSAGSFPAFSNSTSTDNPHIQNGSAVTIHDWSQASDASFTGALRPAANAAVQFDGNSAAGAATATNWSSVSAASTTPGAPNGVGSANETWILGLQGVAAEDPNIDAPTAALQFGRILSSTTQDLDIVVSNVGAAQNLNVAGSTITGTGAAAFSIQAEPTGIAPGGTGNFTVRFDPASVDGVYEALLTINSDDSGADTIEVPLVGSAADVASFAGLYITEMVSTPTDDELVEIQNTSGATIDISGVVISDEDGSNTEGAVKFPAGTMLAADEVIVVGVNNSTGQPSWLATVPAGTRVFFDPIRNGGLWTAPAGVTLVAMEEFDVIDGGTSGDVALSGDDGVALYHPLTRFGNTFGASAPSMCLDGLNYDNTATSPLHPINSNGDFDIMSTRAGAGQPAAGDSLKRLSPAVNTDSSAAFASSTGLTPGVAFPAASIQNWTILND